MCGVAGILRWDQTGTGQPCSSAALSTEIRRMTQAIAHRGPDGDGFHIQENIALGHRRLSIIDLATGAQPMCNEDGRIWITFNGEIYNYRDLTDELRAVGHIFKTRCDTEVVVHAYEQWGDDCVRRLRGMFAFAIADFRQRRVFLARDPVGIKPLVYRTGPGFFAFASELNALRQVSAPAPRGRLDAVDMFLRFQYIPAPWTIFDNCWKLPAGHRLSITFDGRRSAPEPYWNLDFEPRRDLTEAQWLARFDETLARAVDSQLMSDVPFGVLLSGGVDSTLIALHMSRILGRSIRGFTIGYEEQDYSELKYAAQVAGHCGFELVTDTLQSDIWDTLPQLVQHYGEPFGDSSAVPTWAVSRLARQSVPLVLSGDGGDETFGGYHTYEYWLRPDLRRHWRNLRFARSRDALAALLWALVRRHIGRTGGPSALWQREVQWARASIRRELWRPEHLALLDIPSPSFEDWHAHAPRHDALAYAQYLDFKTYLPECILTKVDIAAMANGLEVRPPLLDLQVLDLARQLPRDMRVHARADELIRKYLPKQALATAFPPDFIHRPKQGFSIPARHWFAASTRGAEVLRDVLLDRSARIHCWFNTPAVEHLLQSHSGASNQSPVLWLLLTLELWLQQNREVLFEGPSTHKDEPPQGLTPIAPHAPGRVPSIAALQPVRSTRSVAPAGTPGRAPTAACDLYVTEHPTRHGWGGAQSFGRGLLGALRDRGLRARSLRLSTSPIRDAHLTHSEESIVLDISTSRCFWRLPNYRLTARIARALRDLPPPRHAIVCMTPHAVLAAREAWPTARVVYRVPCFLTNCLPFTWPQRRPPSIWARLQLAGIRDAERAALAAADAVLVPTAHARQEALELQPAAADRVRICRFGPHPAAPMLDLRARQRAALGCETDRFLALAVGLCDLNKDFDLAVRAWRQVDPRATLLIVGHGPEHARLANTVANLGLQDRVRLVGPQTDMQPWYAAADCVISTSQYDLFPNAVLEALAAGRPVVVPRHDPPRVFAGAAELIRNEGGGLIYERNTTALAHAVNRLVCEPDLHADLAVQAGHLAARRAGWSACVDAILGIPPASAPHPVAAAQPDSAQPGPPRGTHEPASSSPGPSACNLPPALTRSPR